MDFTAVEQAHGLPAGLLSAVMQVESGGDPKAVSPAGAQGAFQFMPATAKQYGVNPFDLASSAQGAASYMSDLLKKYDGNVDKALAAYNWGPGNLDKFGMDKIPTETRDYIKKVRADMPAPTANPYEQFIKPPAASADANNPYAQFVNPSRPAVQPQTPQMTGVLREPAIAASGLAKGVLEDVGLPGAVAKAYDKYIGHPFSEGMHYVFGTPTGGKGIGDYIAGPQQTVQAGRALGIVDRPDLQPQNAGERYLAAGSEGLGSALPFGVGGGVPGLLRIGVQGVGGGVGGQVGRDAFPGSRVAPLVGGLMGAMTGGGVTGAVSRGVNAVRNPSPVIQAYKTAGVTPNLVGDVTGSPFMQRVQDIAMKSPGGETRTQAAMHNNVQQFGNGIERTASAYGNSRSLQDAGTVLQQEGRNWLQNFKAQSKALWGKVDLYMDTKAPVPASNYATTLQNVSKTMEDAPSTAKVLQPSLSMKLLESLEKDTASQSLPNLSGAQMSWGTLKSIRSRIGEMLSDPNLPADTGTAELKRLYAAITKDMEAAAEQHGEKAAQAFTDAANYSRQGHDFIDTTLGGIVRKGVTPERAASSVLSSGNRGGSVLAQIRNEMPNAADELAAFKIRDMGKATKGVQNAAGDAVSMGSFLTDYNALSPEAKAALFPGTTKRLNALTTVAERAKDTAAKSNASQTGSFIAHSSAFKSPVDAILGALAGHAYGGVPGAMAGGFMGGVAPFIPGFVSSRLAVNAPLARYLASRPAAISSGLKVRGLLGANVPNVGGLLGAGTPSGLLQ
jgi:hypothetical protein